MQPFGTIRQTKELNHLQTDKAEDIPPRKTLAASLIQWVDSDHQDEATSKEEQSSKKIDLVRCIPFIILHLGCLGVIWTSWSWTAVAVAIGLYFVRMFAITGFYHRYFSHRAFKTSRAAQFVFAIWGATSVQRGALWWAHHHRSHHSHSDSEEDTHSPHQHGLAWSHFGWITCSKNFHTDYSRIKDFAKYPELVFLNRFDSLIPFLFALILYVTGSLLEEFAPGLGVTGAQLLVWGFFISTTVLFHITCCINSLAHVMGTRRFETDDQSRNNLLLALLTLGEGWHNNHHHYMSSARQGFYWWEIDLTYYGLKLMERLGIIWELKPVPARVYERADKTAES